MYALLVGGFIVKGSDEELRTVLKLLRTFGTENFERHNTQHDCVYLERVTVKRQSLKDFTDEAIDSFLEETGNKISVSVSGPYGTYSDLRDAGLYEAVADAVPGAWFKGDCSGYIGEDDVIYSAELREGKLHLNYHLFAYKTMVRRYFRYVQRKLPYKQFCNLFKVEMNRFNRADYRDFMLDAIGYDSFPNMDYDHFKEYCRSSLLEENEYGQVIEQIRPLRFPDFETYTEKFEGVRCDEYRVYDPVTKTYQVLQAEKVEPV